MNSSLRKKLSGVRVKVAHLTAIVFGSCVLALHVENAVRAGAGKPAERFPEFERLEFVRPLLPPDQRVGYIWRGEGLGRSQRYWEETARFYRAQSALAPTVLLKGTDFDYVLDYFDGAVDGNPVEPAGFRLIAAGPHAHLYKRDRP